MTVKKKKSAREKRVLIASLIVAGVIVAGSTFAWFTSKDEVTNRLSANASYNVAIGETFQPPEGWAPGQTIDKDTYAVNSGNVGALARMWLTGSLRVMNYDATNGIDLDPDACTFNVVDLIDVKNSNLVSAGLTKMDDKGNYYRTLSTAQTLRANYFQTTNQQGFPDDKNVALSEVQAMQTGILAHAPDKAEYTFVTNQPTTLKIYAQNATETTPSYQDVLVPEGILVHVGATTPIEATINADGEITAYGSEKAPTHLGGEGTKTYNTVYVEAQDFTYNATKLEEAFQPVPVEYETFTPISDGLYLFLRNEEFDTTGERKPEFSGYYKVTTAAATTTTPQKVTYYALKNDKATNRSDYTVLADAAGSNGIIITYGNSGATISEANDFYIVPTNDLKLAGASYTEYNASNMKYYTNDKADIVYIVYDDGTKGKFDPEKDIYVEVNIANLEKDSTMNPATPAKWQAVGVGNDATFTGITGITKDASKLTYYYKGVIGAGKTSEKLVDSVKLGELTTSDSFLAMDFDLNVHLESIQVTVDADGNEMLTTNAWEATNDGTADINTGATGAGTQDSSTPKKITEIEWTKSTP